MDYDQLSRMVAMGIAASVGDLKSALGDRALGGYALCVDDSLRTVFPVAASAAFLAEQDAEVRFVPVDWDIEEGADDRFDHANAALGELADHARDYAVHIRLAFAALVDALDRVRKSGVFAPGVTLLVTSTDPGELTLRLADDAVLKLNDAETQRAFREIMR
jgi:hypothetical protein